MTNIINDFLEALDERASQVGGLNGGHQYIIGYLNGTLKDLKLQEYELNVLKRNTEQLNRIIEEEKKVLDENK